MQVLSTALIKKHDLVVAEELRSKNLLKNHALSQSISEAGWRSFLNMLAYKADLYGKEFLTIDPKYTTQRCHQCGSIMGQNGYKKLTLKDREWTYNDDALSNQSGIGNKNILFIGSATAGNPNTIYVLNSLNEKSEAKALL